MLKPTTRPLMLNEILKPTTRPVLLNLGQGVANDEWKGGWAKPEHYREFVKGCDVVSFDIYPACSKKPNVAGKLELVPLGVDRLSRISTRSPERFTR